MRHLLPLLALLCVLDLFGQGEPMRRPATSTEYWMSAGVEVKPFRKPSGRIFEKRFFRKFRSYVELGYRSQENITDSRLLYTTIGGRYRENKHLAFGLDYRYNWRDRSSRNTGRIDGQVTLSKEFGDLEAAYRINYQHEFTEIDELRSVIRNRVQVEYNAPKFPLDPVASVEVFNALDPQVKGVIGMRYTLSVKFDLGKDHAFEVGIRHDREQGIPDPRYRYIFLVAYEHTLRWD